MTRKLRCSALSETSAQVGRMPSFLLLQCSRLKARGVLQERQLYGSGWAVSLLSDDEFGHALQLGLVGLVHFFAKNEGDHISVLLDGAGFAQVGELRAMSAVAAAFGRAAQLRERDHGNAQLLGDRLQTARDGGDFLRAVFEAASA